MSKGVHFIAGNVFHNEMGALSFYEYFLKTPAKKQASNEGKIDLNLHNLKGKKTI